jgi:hypothetical protein
MYHLIKIIKTIAFRQESNFLISLTLIILFFITHSPWEIHRQACNTLGVKHALGIANHVQNYHHAFMSISCYMNET